MRTILPWIPILVLLLIVFLSIRSIKRKSNPALAYILVAGVLFGIIGLFAGMVTAVIMAPRNNLLPIIGIFITGPAGFIIGLFAGWFFWKKKKSRAQAT